MQPNGFGSSRCGGELWQQDVLCAVDTHRPSGHSQGGFGAGLPGWGSLRPPRTDSFAWLLGFFKSDSAGAQLEELP